MPDWEANLSSMPPKSNRNPAFNRDDDAGQENEDAKVIREERRASAAPVFHVAERSHRVDVERRTLAIPGVPVVAVAEEQSRALPDLRIVRDGQVQLAHLHPRVQLGVAGELLAEVQPHLPHLAPGLDAGG